MYAHQGFSGKITWQQYSQWMIIRICTRMLWLCRHSSAWFRDLILEEKGLLPLLHLCTAFTLQMTPNAVPANSAPQPQDWAKRVSVSHAQAVHCLRVLQILDSFGFLFPLPMPFFFSSFLPFSLAIASKILFFPHSLKPCFKVLTPAAA